jgi:single-strand DNA-binding protein
MPQNVNTVIVSGNSTREPELRYTPSGQGIASFGIAANRRWQNRQTQEWEEKTSFFDVTCWGDLAEHVAESISKGTRVLVTGRLEQRSWDDKDTGDKRSKIEIVADDVTPSLIYATAEVTKTERKGAQENGPSRAAATPEWDASTEPF